MTKSLPISAVVIKSHNTNKCTIPSTWIPSVNNKCTQNTVCGFTSDSLHFYLWTRVNFNACAECTQKPFVFPDVVFSIRIKQRRFASSFHFVLKICVLLWVVKKWLHQNSETFTLQNIANYSNWMTQFELNVMRAKHVSK